MIYDLRSQNLSPRERVLASRSISIQNIIIFLSLLLHFGIEAGYLIISVSARPFGTEARRRWYLKILFNLSGHTFLSIHPNDQKFPIIFGGEQPITASRDCPLH